jgi:hypothetical protein
MLLNTFPKFYIGSFRKTTIIEFYVVAIFIDVSFEFDVPKGCIISIYGHITGKYGPIRVVCAIVSSLTKK